jgi:hypothetical protein
MEFTAKAAQITATVSSNAPTAPKAKNSPYFNSIQRNSAAAH